MCSDFFITSAKSGLTGRWGIKVAQVLRVGPASGRDVGDEQL